MATPPRTSRGEPAPKLFLSCGKDCFEPYLRQELSYFDFTRDPYLADITVVIVRQPSGSAGERFTVTLTGRGVRPSGAKSFSVAAGTPVHAARQALLQLILRRLLEELAGSEHETAFRLELPRRNGAVLSTLADTWDYWVISPELRGEGEGGSGFYFFQGVGALTLRRITSLSKLRWRTSYTRRWSGFLLEDGSRIRGDTHGWDSRLIYARSLGERWALGGVVTGRTSEFENLEGHVHGGPLLELNLFPYAENVTRQLRFAYQTGAWGNWYIEPNRARAIRELRPYHAVSIIADLNQRWGSVQWVGQLNSFVDRPKAFRLSSGTVFSLRLFEGFSVQTEGKIAWVRDLINLRGRPINDQELLLWTAEQPTGYTFEVKFGVSYTFGSIHNTIVNPRFARVDLDDE
ncbi:MAG TPA: hypothetical protein VFQ61_36555 [Polyangiaceae bacterium]|nr:hypothetical protein [Polyangiaceae bacterium]